MLRERMMRKVFQTSFIRRLRRRGRQLAGRDIPFNIEVKLPYAVLGSTYGAWAVCPQYLRSNSTIYSFGIGRDLSFDLSLIEQSQVHVHAFDPTPLAIEWLKTQDLPSNVHVYEWGIADFDGTAYFDFPETEGYVSCSISDDGQCAGQVHTLATIMDKLNHEYVDVLKMDVEGAEYAAVKQIMSSDCNIGQLLIEFHYNYGDRTEMATAAEAIELIKSHGFHIFWISDVGKEFAFIHKSLLPKS